MAATSCCACTATSTPARCDDASTRRSSVFPTSLDVVTESGPHRLTTEALADRRTRLILVGRLRATDPELAAEQLLALLVGPLEALPHGHPDPSAAMSCGRWLGRRRLVLLICDSGAGDPACAASNAGATE
ncbi:TetR/AcrR family transcriptional regulator C-terminal domain-containing protein [Nonomuraea dietziae]|uniref:TetR/AcrR family transcriptional regulator C-terminal domain-containing protein n=1 Tax=Nonomuraea dietziae TaxID=65515 RepID=UPI001620C86A